MPWTALFAVMALLGLQLAIAAVSLYAYNRIRSQQDSAGQQREAWSAQLTLAMTNADSARRTAETIEVEHFKRLRALYEIQGGELAEAKARISSLEQALKVCQTKLASEERINRRDEQRKRKAEEAEKEPEGEAEPGQIDLDDLLRQRGVPLAPQHPAAPAAPGRPAGFGQMARKM